MGRKRTGRKKKCAGFSLDEENIVFLDNLPKKSSYVNQAIYEKRKREENLEAKLKEIKKEKREMAKELNRLQDEEEKIQERLEEQKKRIETFKKII